MASPAATSTPMVVADASGRPRGLRWGLFLLLLGIGAATMRWAFLTRAGLLSVGAYDDGVHYAAAANLLAGYLPYRDFVFLHPPGIVLLGTPFAALAHVVGDPVAFVGFRATGWLIGALDAVLVALVLRRFGWSAAISGGVLYALAFPAVYGERTALLEPSGEACLLLALLFTGRGRDVGAKRWYWLAGLAAGLSLDFKAWYVGPALVLVLFMPNWAGRWRALIGAALSAGIIYLPFLALSNGAMFRMLVLDQLGRPKDDGATDGVRASSILGVAGPPDNTSLAHVPRKVIVVTLVIMLALLCLTLLFERRAWVYLALLGVDLAITLLAPSYFQHYAILTATPLALIGGAAVGRLPGLLTDHVRRRRALAIVFTLLAVSGAVLVNARHDLSKSGQRPPNGLFSAMQQVHGCVVADDPTLLAVANTLTRDLARGCDVVPDLSGISYDYGKRLGPDGQPIERGKNVYFQTIAANYLRSGSAYIRTRGGAYNFSGAREALLRSGPVLYHSGGYTLRSTAKPVG